MATPPQTVYKRNNAHGTSKLIIVIKTRKEWVHMYECMQNAKQNPSPHSTRAPTTRCHNYSGPSGAARA